MSRENLFSKYCLAGLERMYIASENIFSAVYRLRNGAMVNERERTLEYRYSMNTLMGLYKVRKAKGKIFCDIEDNYRRLSKKVREQSNSIENIAATVWTGKFIEVPVPAEATSLFIESLRKREKWDRFTAQAVAWLIAACLSCGDEFEKEVKVLAAHALERYIHRESGLVRHLPGGFRSDFSSFAANCYMSYAFLLIGRKIGDPAAREAGLKIARKLVSLQGPQGQWAWFYNVPAGIVADYYPIYSVHQHAMAPFFLLEAIDQGFDEFREPLVRGFKWILGNNELAQSMVSRENRVVWRSAVRREPLGRLTRFARAISARYSGSGPSIVEKNSLYINRQCRSYELGWALYAFSGRSDFDEILDDASFT